MLLATLLILAALLTWEYLNTMRIKKLESYTGMLVLKRAMHPEAE